MNEIILINKFLPKVTKAEYRFLKFIRNTSMPIEESKIIEYYSDNVQERDYRETYDYNSKAEYVRISIPYTREEIYSLAMAWFDRNMGKTIRKGIVTRLKIITGEQTN